jgi:uncharacterized protein YbjT (DUF2867 family)
MSSVAENVLVFGATGAVGCAAAIEAHRRGANVWLAMRDTNKTIKGLKEVDLASGRYNRVQADLSVPETVKRVAQQSKAVAAFVYTVFESEDNMRGTFDALKHAGCEHVVILSSYSVKDSPADERNMQYFIESIHAKAEIALIESGISSTAIRPMYFNSNVLWYQDGIRQGKVQLVYPDATFDYLSPTDVGTTCGAVISERNLWGNGNQIIPLCGPELLTQRSAMGIVGRVFGREITIEELDEEAWYEKQLKIFPRPVVDSITHGMREDYEGHNMFPNYAEASANILKYTGRHPTRFQDWLEIHKAAFE